MRVQRRSGEKPLVDGFCDQLFGSPWQFQEGHVVMIQAIFRCTDLHQTIIKDPQDPL